MILFSWLVEIPKTQKTWPVHKEFTRHQVGPACTSSTIFLLLDVVLFYQHTSIPVTHLWQCPPPTKCLELHPWSLWICDLTCKRGWRFQMGLRLPIIWPWDGETVWYRWVLCHQRAGREVRVMLCKDSTRLLLALKVEDGAMSQGKWTPVETGKGEEADSPLESQQEGSPAHMLVFAQRDPCWTSDLWNC